LLLKRKAINKSTPMPRTPLKRDIIERPAFGIKSMV
jgi:hypothetical protein